MSKLQSYSIDDGHGNTLTAGLQPHLARKVAQEKANERQESVWLYDPASCRDGLDLDGEEIEPEECEGHPTGPSDPMGQTVYCDGSCRS